jgi:hypothetical protein
MAVAEKEEVAAPSKPLHPRGRAWEILAVGVLLWLLAACLQWKAGAFSAEFGSHPDEAAHYTTGVMIRDYIVSGHFRSPLAYAQDYYVHYPKLALGAWPPLFHFTEAVWTTLFTPGKPSVLLFEALLTTIVASSLYWLLRKRYPTTAAVLGGALFVLLPIVQLSTLQVMADMLVAVFIFWAMAFFIRYLEDGRTRDGVWFGLFTALAMATKANGDALVLLPLIAFAITGRWHLLFRRATVYAGLIILFIGVPFEVICYRFIQRMGVPHLTLAEKLGLFLWFGRQLLASLGWGLSAFFLLGIVLFAVQLVRRKEFDATLTVALSLLISLWVFHAYTGIQDPRYEIFALPPAILFIFSGFQRLVRWIASATRLPAPATAVVLGAVVAVVFFAQVWRVPQKPYWGYTEAAQYVMSNPAYANANFLVVGNACGEGAFITEVLMRDHRPGHAVFRASKAIQAANKWYDSGYQLRFQTDASLRDFLDQAPISAIVLDTNPITCGFPEGMAAEFNTVQRALASDSHWTVQGNYPLAAGGKGPLVLYARVGPQPSGSLNLDLQNMLGKSMTYSGSDKK